MESLPKMTQAELNQRITKGKYVLFFTADWCPDCNFIKPAMPSIEADFVDYTFMTLRLILELWEFLVLWFMKTAKKLVGL